tara:strand:+ start:1358 stop:1870 length:513 start_codon:yes stop_codon:yes gene_type:complete
MEGVTYIEEFVVDHNDLFQFLYSNVNWDSRLASRKTASFGVPYNYSQINYPFQEFPKQLQHLVTEIEKTLGFKPNNCLINYYLDGKSKMGYHSDQTDILVENTGIAIVSLGETRTLRFRNITDQEMKKDFPLPSGSLIHMTSELQDIWQHSIPKANTLNGRMSLTFRLLK